MTGSKNNPANYQMSKNSIRFYIALLLLLQAALIVSGCQNVDTSSPSAQEECSITEAYWEVAK